jgi:hypothetical protein
MSAADKKAVADKFRRATAGSEKGPVFPRFIELDPDDLTPRCNAPPRSNPQRSMSWNKILLLGCVIVAGAYWLIRPSPFNKAELPVARPGWDDLAPCAALESLDEMKEMTLSDDQRAEFVDTSPLEDGEDPKSRIAEGVWSYDEGSKPYAITLNGQTTTYTLLARGEPTTCILFKGDLHAADLSASWFSFPSSDEPPDDDRERPDPY